MRPLTLPHDWTASASSSGVSCLSSASTSSLAATRVPCRASRTSETPRGPRRHVLHALRARSSATGSRDELDNIVLPPRPATASYADLDIEPIVSPIKDIMIQNELKTLEVLANEEKRYESLIALVGLAIAFGGGIWYTQGVVKAQEYFAGYLLEQSLSVDNLFVFVLVFGYFKTPPAAQAKALTYGIATAAVLRAIMIILGIDLITSFRPVLVFFAGILIFTSYKLLTAAEGGDDDDDLKDNMVVQFCSRWIKVSDNYDGEKFFTTTAAGVREATPLLLVLAVIELSDVLFAVDSIPAVFGVTLDPFIVYTSNLFAIISLRQLFGFVSTMMNELRYLDKAVATVLGFIGLKMLVGFADVEIPTGASLLFVGLILGGGVAASVLLPEAPEPNHEE